MAAETERLVHYRRQLMRISRELSTKEVKRLLFICPTIPKSQKDTVQEGYQLFELLEEQDRLGPEKYDDLVKCLHVIGRGALVKILREPYLQESVHEVLMGISRKQYIQSTRDMISLANNDGLWATVIKESLQATFLVLRMDRPPVYRSDTQQIGTTINKSICGIVCDAFSLGDTFFAMLTNVHHPLNEDLVMPSVNEWHARFAKFDEQCRAITKWIPESRMKVLSDQQSREYPGASCARNVKQYIEQVGTKLLGKEAIRESIVKVDRSLWIAESFGSAGFGWLLAMKCLAAVVVLANSSQISLHDCYSDLEAIVRRHKDHILKSYDLLVRIVGRDVMDKTSQLLQQSGDVEQKLSEIHKETPGAQGVQSDFMQTVSTSFNTFLALLVALASDSEVIPHQAGEKFVELFSDHKTLTSTLQAGVSFLEKLIKHVAAEVEQFRKNVLEKSKSYKPSVQTLIEELLPTVHTDCD